GPGTPRLRDGLFLTERQQTIPGKRGRKRKIRHDKRRYRERWRIEATFNRLKDFRRIATRYDKLARNYASALALAAVIAFWC
ncbi:transposase, partial [Methylorubrum aminovorans]|uniref:transposase n=1 Tax=Methylorubrum aminovorans TaxID=269069 RepID=UPI0031E37EFD